MHGAAACSRGFLAGRGAQTDCMAMQHGTQPRLHNQGSTTRLHGPDVRPEQHRQGEHAQVSTARLHRLEVTHGRHRPRQHAPLRTVRHGGQCCGCASALLPQRLPLPWWQGSHGAALPAEWRLAGADHCCPCQRPRPSAAVRCPLPTCQCHFQLWCPAAAEPMAW